MQIILSIKKNYYIYSINWHLCDMLQKWIRSQQALLTIRGLRTVPEENDALSRYAVIKISLNFNMHLTIFLTAHGERSAIDGKVEGSLCGSADRSPRFVDPHSDRGEGKSSSLRWSTPFKATSSLLSRRSSLCLPEPPRSRARSFARETLDIGFSWYSHISVTSQTGRSCQEGRQRRAGEWGESAVTWRSQPRCCMASWPRPRPFWRLRAKDACVPRDACCWSCRWGLASSMHTPSANWAH